MRVELSKIRLDGDTQSRVEMNQETVQAYTEKVMNGAEFPPVLLFNDGKNLWLVDGFHRYFAHKRAGLLDIESEIEDGSLRDAQLKSTGVNDDHGLPRTHADNRRSVMRLLNDPIWSEWSDQEIARRARVSPSTVHRIKKSLQLDQKTEKKYINKHGQEAVMKIKEIGKQNPFESEKVKEAVAQITAPEDHAMDELASELTALAEENNRLKEQIALESYDVPEEQKVDITEQLESYRQQIRVLETELKAIRTSRDTLQNENAELKKQVMYWRKKAQVQAA